MPTFSDNVSCFSFKLRPTILQVLPALESGGVEIETLEIAKAIVAAGGNALIASQGGRMAKEHLSKGIRFVNLPLDTKNPFQIARNSKFLKEIIIKAKVDIVHARSRGPAWSAYKAARSLDIPFVTTYHAAYGSKTVLKTFYNSVMAKGDRVIAISKFIQDHIIKKYGKYGWFDPSKVRLVQRGIDFHYFDPALISKDRLTSLKKSWGISSGSRIILLPGRISRKKGQDLLIRALSHMKHKDVIAVFVGSDQGHESYRDYLLQYAAALGLEGRVKWFPPSPDLPAAYQLADLIVCPTLVPEGFGRVMVEAQAMKKPIISSNHGASQEIIEEGRTGWLVPPDDAEVLAKVLDKVLDLPQKRLDEMGAKARARALEQFSKEAMYSKTMAVYEELLAKT